MNRLRMVRSLKGKARETRVKQTARLIDGAREGLSSVENLQAHDLTAAYDDLLGAIYGAIHDSDLVSAKKMTDFLAELLEKQRAGL